MGGDLVGGWDWTVWLLVPVALGLALLTALALAQSDEPAAGRRREGGVSRSLGRREATDPSTP